MNIAEFYIKKRERIGPINLHEKEKFLINEIKNFLPNCNRIEKENQVLYSILF